MSDIIATEAKEIAESPTFNTSAFFHAVRQNLFRGQMSQKQVDGINQLGLACRDAQLHRVVEQTSYVLATAYHETARTMQPIEEFGGPHARYAPWYGRGHIQLTWEDNYLKQERKLEHHPARGANVPWQVHQDKNLALHPETSALICVLGMKDGDFTGRKLDRYINGSKIDYVGARRIVNGTDKASTIAGYARKFEEAIREGLGNSYETEEVHPLNVGRVTVSIYQNAEHSNVGLAQWLLKTHRCDAGTVDGQAGPKFQKAVVKFQGLRGLTADGIVGPTTWASLES